MESLFSKTVSPQIATVLKRTLALALMCLLNIFLQCFLSIQPSFKAFVSDTRNNVDKKKLIRENLTSEDM